MFNPRILALLLPLYSPNIQVVNDDSAWIPEYWANESVAILEENMVIGNLVHRNFENILSEAGEIVNTRKPGEFVLKRKGVNSNVTVQAISATNIPVKLNQHLEVTFLIRDREQARSFVDLTAEYLRPALLQIARGVDKILLSQVYRFLRTDKYTVGKIGTDASVSSILSTRKNLNDKKCPTQNRNLIISSKDETALLNLDIFINADKVGDMGTALREASLGRRLGFDIYMCQNVCSVTGTADTAVALLINGALSAGATTLVTDGTGVAVTGQWLTIAGDAIPHYVVSHNETTGVTTDIVIAPPLASAVADNAIITRYTPGAVNQSVAGAGKVTPNYSSAGYESGWEEYIVLDTFTNEPQEGQFLQFSVDGPKYVVLEADPDNHRVLLDRPLEENVANDAVIYLGPVGTYNFAFVRNAMTLVTRPMAIPRAGVGATGANANYKGVGVRVVWAYDKDKQGLQVTVDTLIGVQVLDTDLGEVMIG